MTVLPEKLARYVDDSRLAENAANYPEIQQDLSSGQKAAVQAIRSRLLDISLTHATRLPVASYESRGINPYKLQVTDKFAYHNTHSLDQSLGLDEYVFMHWGGFHKATGYGRNLIAVDTKSVLFSPNTIASPYDISMQIFKGRDSSYEILEPADRLNADKYLDSLVNGELWLEILARKVLQTMVRSKIEGVYLVNETGNFGEIKHYGPIPPEMITHTIESDETKEREEWVRMYENGFALPPVATAIAFGKMGLNPPSMYDKTPEAIGADLGRANQVWAEILDLARN